MMSCASNSFFFHDANFLACMPPAFVRMSSSFSQVNGVFFTVKTRSSSSPSSPFWE
ncbi:hypothetical protein PR003_g26443 [Phytophthora rubi]|uniref:Uncharacterized protein n=1 Tax=Phytophthora rubi TaxID=129364 RepID=A0A6A4C730_9STRA|nr:hypothetical protein PR003_g26443 [Phytophthora rubi]